MGANPQQYMTIEEVMGKLEVTRAQVYRLVKDGFLSGEKNGRSLRFDAGADSDIRPPGLQFFEINNFILQLQSSLLQCDIV